MNTIRRQKNRYNANTDPENWTNRTYEDDGMTDREAMKQIGLIESWKNISNSGDKARIADAELERRISAATEGDTAQTRTQDRIKNLQVEERVAEIRKAREDRFSEDDLQDERKKFGNQYRNDVSRAMREVQQNG